MTLNTAPSLIERSIRTLDCDYLFPRFAAAYLIRDGKESAFIETNTAHSVPRLLSALAEQGLSREDVRYVIVTHVHLDHAGGAQALMKACPRAKLLVHPKGAPHLIDPSKLIASAKNVYGTERFQELYGEFGPISASRVATPADEARVPFGKSELRFLHTRGHANHHFCISWEEEGAVFTGDSFGLRYPDLQGKGLFIFPSTSPTGFEPAEAISTVDRILKCGAKRVFLTHFGELTDLESAARSLREDLEFSGRLLHEAQASVETGSQLEKFCEKRVWEYFESRLKRLGLFLDDRTRAFLKLDLDLNAHGIAYVAEKLASKKG